MTFKNCITYVFTKILNELYAIFPTGDKAAEEQFVAEIKAICPEDRFDLEMTESVYSAISEIVGFIHSLSPSDYETFHKIANLIVPDFDISLDSNPQHVFSILNHIIGR